MKLGKMETNNELELLIKAIDNYDLYIGSEKEILKTMLKIATDNIAIINANSLIQITGYSKPVIYKVIKKLERDKIIVNTNSKSEPKSRFKINQDKLDEIINAFNKKEKLLKI